MVNLTPQTPIRDLSDLDLLQSLALATGTVEAASRTGLTLPTWYVTKTAEMDQEAVARGRQSLVDLRDRLMKQRASLMTPDEKRNSLDSQITALNQKLSG